MNHFVSRMIRHIQFISLALLLLAPGCCSSSTRLHYPATAKTNVVDVYHGTSVPDPYRWLEDDNSAETKAWVIEQNKVTQAYLDALPGKGAILARLTRLWDYERYGTPFKEGGRYFYTHNTGLQNQSILYTVESLEAEPRVLLDPNTLSSDGTIALAATSVSDEGSLLAYGTSTSGSDWVEWHVRDVRTGRDLPDRLLWTKNTHPSWKKDGSGFFYSRYDAPKPGDALKGLNKFNKLYYHQLGQDQSADELVYERRDKPEWSFAGKVTEDGRYLIIDAGEGSERKDRILYKDLTLPGSAVTELLMNFDAGYEFIGNEGALFWFKTDLKSPRGRVVAIDINRPQQEHWREIIPQAADTLDSVTMANNEFVANYLKDARTEVKIFDQAGAFLREVTLPGIGTASGFKAKRTDRETFYTFASFTTPGTIYRYDAVSGASTVFRQPKVDFDASQYETTQVFCTRKDGTRVPMFLVHKRGLKLNGKNPTLLYGYGGFDISLTPSFNASRIAWLEMGGIYAVANLRGGGEYGEDWHQAGVKLRKQNVFDDFIAAAEWLIANRYTYPNKLAIQGGSNGGLLVGACMTQRPDLFGAALPQVGVMDMLRFDKFTIGWGWRSDYGSADNLEEFRALYAYSPYHNLKPGVRYPSTLITTGDHDDRVVPAHSFKFAARLQEYHKGNNPVLIRIETKAGHGAGKPTSMVIEEKAEELSFLAKVLGMTSPPPGPQFQPSKAKPI
jgi:prolyl oligopeptidase